MAQGHTFLSRANGEAVMSQTVAMIHSAFAGAWRFDNAASARDALCRL